MIVDPALVTVFAGQLVLDLQWGTMARLPVQVLIGDVTVIKVLSELEATHKGAWGCELRAEIWSVLAGAVGKDITSVQRLIAKGMKCAGLERVGGGV